MGYPMASDFLFFKVILGYPMDSDRDSDSDIPISKKTQSFKQCHESKGSGFQMYYYSTSSSH